MQKAQLIDPLQQAMPGESVHRKFDAPLARNGDRAFLNVDNTFSTRIGHQPFVIAGINNDGEQSVFKSIVAKDISNLARNYRFEAVVQ